MVLMTWPILFFGYAMYTGCLVNGMLPTPCSGLGIGIFPSGLCASFDALWAGWGAGPM